MRYTRSSVLHRPTVGVLRYLLLSIWLWACSQHTVLSQDDEGFPSVQLNDAHSDKERLAATPAYVISGKEERWEHSRSVLATLHITAERVWPPKPSLHLARTMFAFHDHDKQASMADEHHQRYMSLLAAWRQALGHIAHRPDLAPDEWALVFEDDISLHDDLTLSAARAAILRGFSLARADGWLYLGVCLADGDGQGCLESTAEVHDGVKYAKCIGLCSHALAFTQRKAGTMLADMHAGMKRFMDLYGSYPIGHSIDQMLKQHTLEQNGTWTLGTDLKVHEPPYEDTNVGLFSQDRELVSSTILHRRVQRRMMRATLWPR